MEKRYDAIIVGGGPAGLSAAIYMARAQFHVLVIEKDTIGGQITITGEVVNYPGIPYTNGKKLTAGMHSQAESFGAEFLTAEVTGLDLEGTYKTVHTTGEISQQPVSYMQPVLIRVWQALPEKKSSKVMVWHTVLPVTANFLRIRMYS